MSYNLDFLLAALIFLLVLWYHFIKQRQFVDNKNEKIFQLFMIVGIGDIVLDLVSTMMIAANRPEFSGLLYAILVVFYLFQLLVPFALYIYILSLSGWKYGENLPLWNCICMIPTAILFLMLIFNHWSGILFSATAEGAYIRGELYLAMYIQAIFYACVIAVESVIKYSVLGKQKCSVIWEVLLIMVSCVLIQSVYHAFLMTGFAIALCIMVLLLSFHNSYVYIDNLTGFLDLSCYQEWVEDQCRKKRDFHMIAVDLRQLKRMNTVYGVVKTNELLKQTAIKIRELTDSSYIFRISGRRIVIGLYSFEKYEKLQQDLAEFFRKPMHIDGEDTIFPVILCGIPYANRENSQHLLAYMEYLIGLMPKNEETVLVRKDKKTKEGFIQEKTIEEYLPKAIREDLFQVFYQPVYSMREKKYISMEALSRLQHPGMGPVSPEIFIRIAEQNGWIDQIGILQFERVCRFVKEHPQIQEHLQNIKYNLSPAQLLKKGYGKTLLSIIEAYGLKPSFFQFEITETVATKYREELYEAVEEFVQGGISLCMDDFGSGYANLNAVLRLPFECIKMDRSMLQGIRENETAGRFYRDIITILRRQGYVVIAEGVEEKEEAHLLERWGIDLIQGYYFSKPLPPEEILQLLKEKPEN